MKKNSKHALPPKCRKIFVSLQYLIGIFAGFLVIFPIVDITYFSFPKTAEDVVGFLIFEFLFCTVTLFVVIRLVDNIILNPVYGSNFKVSELNKLLTMKLFPFFIDTLIFISIFFFVFPISFFSAYGFVTYLGLYIHIKRLSGKEEFKKMCETYILPEPQKPELSKISRILFNIFISILLFLTLLVYQLGRYMQGVLNVSLVLVLAIFVIFVIMQKSDSPKAQKIGDAVLAAGIIWMGAVIIYTLLYLMGVIGK